MSNAPYLFLDVDGVLHGARMKYGFERTHTIRERIPYAEVHPANRTRRVGKQELPEWVARRRGAPSHVTFNTPVRVSPRLLGDIAALDADPRPFIWVDDGETPVWAG